VPSACAISEDRGFFGLRRFSPTSRRLGALVAATLASCRFAPNPDFSVEFPEQAP